MRLLDLEPKFLRYDGAIDPTTFGRVSTLGEANGIVFICPKCFHKSGFNRSGVHSVMCWAPVVPLDIGLVGPGRWELHGTGLHDLTLVAGSSSVQLLGGCAAHFFVREGAIIGCGGEDVY